jgi:hypothetical protein
MLKVAHHSSLAVFVSVFPITCVVLERLMYPARKNGVRGKMNERGVGGVGGRFEAPEIYNT